MMTRILLPLVLAGALIPRAEAEILDPTEAAVVVAWDEAPDYVSYPAVVYGRVVIAKKTDRRCYLNFHTDYRDHFTVVINSDAFGNFAQSPEKLFGDKNVVVFGYLQGELGKPEMYVSSPENIHVAPDDPAALLGFARSKFPKARTPSDIAGLRKTRKPDGTLRVATYNVLNLFDEHDDPYRADEVMRPKPRQEMERVAARIRQLDADVIALQEVENKFYLRQFVLTFLPDMGYEDIVLIEANNHRGIDCAILSRYPVGPVTTHQFARCTGPDGKVYPFQRDLLKARIMGPEGFEFDMYCVHLKSKYGGAEASEPLRQAEATYIRELADQVLKNDAQAPFLIAGDFNDSWDSKSLEIIRGSGRLELKCPGADLEEKLRVTYNKEPYLSMIDFILMSPAMHKRFIKGSYSIIPGKVDDSGSDHNPSVAAFKVR